MKFSFPSADGRRLRNILFRLLTICSRFIPFLRKENRRAEEPLFGCCRVHEPRKATQTKNEASKYFGGAERTDVGAENVRFTENGRHFFFVRRSFFLRNDREDRSGEAAPVHADGAVL